MPHSNYLKYKLANGDFGFIESNQINSVDFSGNQVSVKSDMGKTFLIYTASEEESLKVMSDILSNINAATRAVSGTFNLTQKIVETS
tara:strand:+ start:7856 stop:8116 length:261 start_codon:yes stop_codon:yes gene_type:complete